MIIILCSLLIYYNCDHKTAMRFCISTFEKTGKNLYKVDGVLLLNLETAYRFRLSDDNESISDINLKFRIGMST